MRNDRLQLLAYSMMLDANNVGIILPVQNNENDTDKTNEVIFDARRINTMENRIVKYHQMLLGMMKDSSSVL